ncbi:MAG TPA: T9SS type A sorting domain-containing protein, partial [Flavobacterium alvei]|nr:T9SS type A sorting domain-containing protein [Flavobacterium alvei]
YEKYKIYPNPTSDIINISLVDEAQKPVTTSKIVAELYDFTGQPKYKVEVKNNIASINCNGLSSGIYILKIIIDGNVESHQVFVQ